MEMLNEMRATHGLWLVFIAVLLDQGGVPIPAWPPLVVASAQAVELQAPVWPILLVATMAELLADSLWYLAGRRSGAVMLRLFCRVSLPTDICVSSTAGYYANWVPPLLATAKLPPSRLG